MNNATLALNAARPAAPAATAPGVSGKADEDAGSSSKRFDAAMNAARADARKPKDTPADKSAPTKSADTTQAAVSKTAKKPDDDAAKKDDKPDDGDDTSIASTMLALIGVPPKVTDAATKLPGIVKDAAAQAGAALGAVVGAGTASGEAAEGIAATKDGMPVSPDAGTTLAGATTPATGASPFAALLATQGGDLAGAKDDAATKADPANTSPMPFLHTQGLGQVDGPAVQVQASQPATSPQFSQELGEQIAWMGSGDIKEARIKLHPEELGSMDVRVNMDGGKVNVAIMVQHPAAVHAVQQTLSQLDSMLAHHGLSLGQADVGQQQAGQDADAQAGNASAQGVTGDDGTTNGTLATSAVSRGLLDERA